MDKHAVSDLQREYLQIFNKVESLIAVGADKGICNPRDLSELKRQVYSLRDHESFNAFKRNGYHAQLVEQMRVCGRVCCEEIVKPNSLKQAVTCSSCPIYLFEKRNTD